MEATQLICTVNQLSGFYIRATVAFNGLRETFESFLWRLTIILEGLITSAHH